MTSVFVPSFATAFSPLVHTRIPTQEIVQTSIVTHHITINNIPKPTIMFTVAYTFDWLHGDQTM